MARSKKSPTSLGESTSEILKPENTEREEVSKVVTAQDLVDAIEWIFEQKFCTAQRLGNQIVRLLVADILPVAGKLEQANPVIHQSFSGNWTAALLSCHSRYKLEKAKLMVSTVMPNAN